MRAHAYLEYMHGIRHPTDGAARHPTGLCYLPSGIWLQFRDGMDAKTRQDMRPSGGRRGCGDPAAWRGIPANGALRWTVRIETWAHGFAPRLFPLAQKAKDAAAQRAADVREALLPAGHGLHGQLQSSRRSRISKLLALPVARDDLS